MQSSYKNIQIPESRFLETESWYVLCTKPKQEKKVVRQLRQLDIEVFFPELREKSYVYGKIVDRVAPLFPQYLFSRFSLKQSYDNVRWLTGMKSVLSFNNGPVTVSDEVVEFFKGQLSEDGVIIASSEFRVNQEVEICKGPLKDLRGIFLQNLSGAERVIILLNTMGTSSRVQIHPACLRAV